MHVLTILNIVYVIACFNGVEHCVCNIFSKAIFEFDTGLFRFCLFLERQQLENLLATCELGREIFATFIYTLVFFLSPFRTDLRI